jgi:hypothetical protein
MVRLSKPLHRDVPGEENEYFYEPRGVAVVTVPVMSTPPTRHAEPSLRFSKPT